MLNVPILFIIFNRPDLTKQVFETIRSARPLSLFVAADGPRANVPSEAELCASTREVIELVDWDCEVHTLFRETNQGCKKAVSSAVDWFFEHVEAGIILEDDCVSDATFFPFCAELLERYHDDEHVMVISGDNFQQGRRRTPYSYYFSYYNHIWGWASWRRAWQHYDGEMKQWPELRDTSFLFDILGEEAAIKYWRAIFDRVYAGKIDTWDYSWTFSCWAQDGLTCQPEVNLVSNIGFGDGATHTRDNDSDLANLPTAALQFPLRHPPRVVRHLEADLFTAETVFQVVPEPQASFFKRAGQKVRRVPSTLMLYLKRQP